VAATNLTITVTGEVEPGANSNKWYNTWAFCRGVRARVNPEDGTFSLPGVPLYPGTNMLLVRVRDVSGNDAEQTRTVVRTNALETFEYDGNGNLTNWVKAGENWAYEWDWADRLVKASSNGVVVLENWFDAQSRKIAKAEVVNGQMVKTLYLYDGWDIVGVMNETGQMRETFTRGVGLAGDIGTLVAVTHHPASWTNGTFYAHHNHRGDVILTRSGATTAGRYDYAAFGSLKSQTGPDVCRFKFSSKERDVSTGFSYYGYRFYAPQWQRWASRDPIMEEGGINLYAFTANNPGSYADSDGRGIIPIMGGILGEVLCGNRIKNQVWNQYKPGGPNHRPEDWSYREAHCVAHCRIQRECLGGRITSWLGGLGKEIWDELKQWDGEGDGFDWGDMEANRKGRRLGRKCPEKSCEELCKGTR